MEIVKPKMSAKDIAAATGMNKTFIWCVISPKHRVKPSWETALKIEAATNGFYKADDLVPEMKEWLDAVVNLRKNV